jgi:hypothetical protein
VAGIEVRAESEVPVSQRSNAFSFIQDGRFKCFGCDESGDAIDLVAKIRHISTVEAAHLISEAFICPHYTDTKKGSTGYTF